jgi:two-component system, NtrC family, sensor kinase
MTEPHAELEERFVVLSAFVGGLFFEFDGEGTYLDIWAAEPRLLARPERDLLGRKVVDVLGDDVGGRFRDVIARVYATGVSETVEYVIDVPAGRRSFRSEARRTRGPGDVPRVTLLVRDITEETELKAKLVEVERFAGMGLLAASIGHEIRQPLAFATTSLAVLARHVPLSGHAGEALAHVQDAIRRIGEIVANVGVVVRARGAAMTDVRRPILAAVDLCASALQGCATLDVEVPDRLHAAINESELCQVLTNLLLNAAHAVAPGKPHRISVRSFAARDKVRIEVADDGGGIHPADVPRIFDPFFTTKGEGGTGLGLFVSRRLVESAGGTLSVDSELGVGTTVAIELPFADEEVPPSSRHVGGNGDAGKRLRVLVIDDERSFLRSLELAIGDLHDVVAEGRSDAALTLLRADPHRFDAVLCDLAMPGIDGVAFYKHAEELGIANRFVLMTAGAFAPHADEFLRRSRVRRITKPFTIEGLLALLEKVAAPDRGRTRLDLG